MVISELITKLKDIISDSSESAILDARLIVSFLTGLNSTGLIVHGKNAVSEDIISSAVAMAEKRAERKPMAYILGKREFMSLDFDVCPGVLIPRPDTECVVEKALELIKTDDKVLDIGTGSGAIAVSIAKYSEKASVSAIDFSETAILCAKRNAENNGVSVNITKADIFDFETDEKFNVIVSNPPYIETEVIDTLEPDVKDYEPLSALDGGEDGLRFYRRISEFAYSHLENGGYLIYEFGWKQHDDVKKIVENAGLTFTETINDLAGIKRGLVAKK